MKRSSPGFARLTAFAAAALVGLGAASSPGEDCAWTQHRDGTESAVCKDGVGRTYCLSCTYAPRVCQRTPC